jgi:hypothetical protein
MIRPATKTQKTKTAKEPSAEYEAAGQYLPVYGKAAALAEIFSKGEATPHIVTPNAY